ncbi:TPA: host cell division inhibitor Icd-like protein [Klebsiella pneumoniae]|nr:hypothetical protein B7D67_22270 [Klebsiella pneumoniae]OSH84163.1 hypothetical protein B7D71_22255 [Klebsiella pneumoniae]OSH84182.1 hypothetical protein B7D71_22360 [Klebsiella pneumoniae]HBY6639397.1 host cell division inhibitor Icd-like protein [Klebsiella pneumoniae]HBY6642975.1 host cell division inhibitor Icd-like protein [Klebsiella pneumoniae]
MFKQEQNTRVSAGGQSLSQRNPYVQINRVRLTYGHRNPLKLFQTVNLQSAQNSLKLLSQLNYREMRELANTLIIPKNTNGAVRLPQIEVLEEINNLVPESHLVHGSSTIGGWGSEAFLYHEENHNIAVLHRNPDLAYERVVPQSHEVNQLSLSKSDNKPSLRGEALISAVPHSANEISPVQEKRKGGISNPTLWLVVYRQTTENPAVHSITESNPVQLSGSDLAFLRCLRLISPFAAVIRNPAVLSPSSFSFSISSKSSRGSLTESCKERLFFLPVAITETSYIRWCSVYTGKLRIKHLKWCSLGYTLVVFTLSTAKAQVRHKMAKPRGASTPSGLLTTNVSVDNEAAMKDHTTHPQGRNNYIWRFLALSAIGRNVIHITAATEREAREQSPAGCVMVFAGRLPVREVRHA